MYSKISFLALVCLILATASGLAGGSAVYIAQNAAGANSGADCANAHAAPWFNTASNWGTGAAQIGPDSVVHLCGAFVGSAGSNMLTFQGSGTAGHPITVLMEPGAVFSAPYWSTTAGAINSNWMSYFVLDGGINGTIQNTANGTAMTYQADSLGVRVAGSSHYTVQNLNISNIYVRTAATGGGAGFDSVCISSGNGDDVLITRNTINNCKTGIGFGANSNTATLEISYNTSTYVEVPIILAPVANNILISGAKIHDNHFGTGAYVWDDPVGNSFHHEAIHAFANGCTGCTIDNVQYYNNLIDGVWGNDATYFTATNGTHVTTLIYMEQINGNAYIYNNVLDMSTCPGGNCNLNRTDNGMIFCKESGSQKCYVYNNTLINSSGDTGFETAGGTGHIVKNNVFKNVFFPIYIPGSNDATAIVADYNWYFGASDWGSSFNGFNTWRNNGQDLHGSNGVDPQLGSNYVPAGTSGLIGAGVNLSGLAITALNSDKSGALRPTSTSWTAGAYNSNVAAPAPPPLTPPAAPTGLVSTVR